MNKFLITVLCFLLFPIHIFAQASQNTQPTLEDTVRKSLIQRLDNYSYPPAVKILKQDLEDGTLSIRVTPQQTAQSLTAEFLIQLITVDKVFPVWLGTFQLDNQGELLAFNDEIVELRFATTVAFLGTYYEILKKMKGVISRWDDSTIEAQFFITFRLAYARSVIAANRSGVMGNPDWYLDESKFSREELALNIYLNLERMSFEDREELHREYEQLWQEASENYQTNFERLLFVALGWSKEIL